MFHVLHRQPCLGLAILGNVSARVAFRFGWMLFLTAIALAPVAAQAATPRVEEADLNGDINNVMSAYMQNAVSRAESDHADALLVVINTPGGISTSMDEIVTSMVNSKVPVIAYVSPTGARAASAGLFVAQAADIVAMAPGTNIGSAHPIQSTGEDLTGDLGAKVLNDAVTRVRSLAAMHGRNADWCEDAVRNSVNINADQAVQLHVADLEATDVSSLLNQLDGRTLQRANGELTLHTAGARVDDFPMPFWQVFLNALIDPTIAALLIIVAGYGIITEMSNPGLILPGVIGGIAAILAIVSLANLPLNIAGALMMLLALVLFIADLKAPTHGFLSVGGVIALVLGMAFLINTGPVGLGVNPIVSAGVAVVTFGFFVFFIRKIWQARRQPAFVGGDSMVGSLGEVREAVAPEGLVFVQGALWKATSTSPIPAGAAVRVLGRNGLQLQVAQANGEKKEKS
jgi:membrane-bound serine protease (ClpP class)